MSDLISRQDTIDRINEYIEEYSEIDSDGNHSEKWCAMQEAKMTIENMPPVQPEQRWIPCDKGEPDEDMECWVTVKTTDALYRGNFTKRYGERRDKGFITSDGFMWWNTALAWMPIYEPEPYRTDARKEMTTMKDDTISRQAVIDDRRDENV